MGHPESWQVALPRLLPSSPFSWPQTLYTNALHALEQLMEGLMQRHLDPKGLQEMVHVSYLEEGQEPVVAQNAGPRARLSVGNRHALRIDLVIFFRQSFKLAEKLQGPVQRSPVCLSPRSTILNIL